MRQKLKMFGATLTCYLPMNGKVMERTVQCCLSRMCVFRKEGMRTGNIFSERKMGDFSLELAIFEWGKNTGQTSATESFRRFAEEKH